MQTFNCMVGVGGSACLIPASFNCICVLVMNEISIKNYLSFLLKLCKDNYLNYYVIYSKIIMLKFRKQMKEKNTTCILLEFITRYGCIFFYPFNIHVLLTVLIILHFQCNFLLFSHMLAMLLNSFYNVLTEHIVLCVVIIWQLLQF